MFKQACDQKLTTCSPSEGDLRALMLHIKSLESIVFIRLKLLRILHECARVTLDDLKDLDYLCKASH